MVDLIALGDGTSTVIAKATKEGLVWRFGYKAIPNLSQVYSKSRWKSGNFGTPRCAVGGTMTSSKWRCRAFSVLANYPALQKGRMWLHFIDNAAALSSLVNGSSVCEGVVIIGATWSRIQCLEVFPWFDRVDSSSNPVDGLSRGRLAGPWTVSRLTFPVSLLPALRHAARQ